MHKLHLFNVNKYACHYNNLYIWQLREVLSYEVISNGYFYIQWMFPVVGESKWHTNTKPFKKTDNNLLRNDDHAINNILKSSDVILNNFSIKRINSKYEFSTNNYYWLRGIGHEEKKISRIAICLMQLGLHDFADSLIQTSCNALDSKGFKSKIDTQKVISFWQDLKNTQAIY